MIISEKEWLKYTKKLYKINKTCGKIFEAYKRNNGDAITEEMIDYVNALVTKYGEASSELACEMYDALAKAQGANIESAIPAPIANRREVAGALYATKGTFNQVPTIERLVKMASSDTMLKNAKRDNAEWAWIAKGDTCPFCLRLSSLGWMPASQAILKGNHAQHIHANCDCEFAIRFDGKSDVEGYDPNKYKKIFDEAEGDNYKEKINYLRREKNKKIKANLYNGVIDIRKQYKVYAGEGIGTLKTELNYCESTHSDEINVAKWILRKFGGNIILKTESIKDNEHTADYWWDGLLWDLKSPKGNGKTTIDNQFRKIKEQIAESPGGMILDCSNLEFTDERILIDVSKRIALDKFEGDVIIKKEDSILAILTLQK